jgi:hypothetical protein
VQRLALRLVVFLFCAGLATLVPFFGLLASVNGAIGYGAMSYLVPPYFELGIIWRLEAAAASPLLQRQHATTAASAEEGHRLTDGMNDVPLAVADDADESADFKVSPSRKAELWAILVVGGIMLLLGGISAVREIVVSKTASNSTSC